MNKRVSFLLGLLAVFLWTQWALSHGLSEADREMMLTGGLLQYVLLGARHMLTGYDHLLFIFGVVFFLTQFTDILKFITAFTVGHSITLIAATFMGITANAYLIDAVIALTVVYKGFDNIDGFRKYLKVNPPNMLVLVFVFGLIHGFGLSTRLQELPLGQSDLLAKIIAFNVGVELGQIAALSVMMLLLAGWRKTSSFARFSVAANLGLIAAGIWLFAFQINGYLHDRHHHETEQNHEERHHQQEAPTIQQEHSHERKHRHGHEHSHEHK